MTDYSELKRLAEAATPGHRTVDKDVHGELHVIVDGLDLATVGVTTDINPSADADFIAAANPAVVLALIAENERLRGKLSSTMGVGSGNGSLFVHGDYDSIKAAQAIVLERDQLKAEVEALRESHEQICTNYNRVSFASEERGKKVDQVSAELESIRKIAIELRASAECSNVHHCKAEQHEFDEPCRVLARIDAAMSKEAGQ